VTIPAQTVTAVRRDWTLAQSSPRLPPEIEDLIIQQCDPLSLLRTHLVCRAWAVRSVRAYCKRVPYELPTGDLPKFRQLIRSVPNLSFTKFTIHDHRIRTFEPALAHSPAVDTLRAYSESHLPVSASSTTLAGLPILELHCWDSYALPLTFLFRILSLNATRRVCCLEPFLATLRPDTLHFMGLCYTYSAQVLNRTISATI
jgi:hypothetical protein